VYLHTWQVTGNAFLRTIIEEILDNSGREMTDPAGGSLLSPRRRYHRAEGKFFLWTPNEIWAVLEDDIQAKRL
jgi:uncharacterized protein YyaL (SSP411 family)